MLSREQIQRIVKAFLRSRREAADVAPPPPEGHLSPEPIHDPEAAMARDRERKAETTEREFLRSPWN